MADVILPRPGARSINGSGAVLYRDEGDGTFTIPNTANLRIWDPINLLWTKALADPAGNLRVSPGAAVSSTGLLFAPVDISSSGDNSIVAAVAAKKIKVASYALVAGGTVACRWKSGATSLSGAMPFVVNSGIAEAGAPGAHLFETAVNTDLILNLNGAIQVSGHLSYFTE